MPRRCRISSQRTKDTLLQSNLNYQKDLNEVAVIVAQKLAGREKEIGDGMAKIYASEFTEQELKDLVTFYKSTARSEIAHDRAQGDPDEHVLYEPVGAEFSEIGQRRVPRRDAQARQADVDSDDLIFGRELTWRSSTSIFLSSGAVRAGCAPRGSPPVTARGS